MCNSISALLQLLFSLTVLTLLALNIQAQMKNVNGKIYDKYPTITIVDEFIDAIVAIDEEKMKSMVIDDFGWWVKNELNPRKSLESLLRRSKYLSKNVIGFEIKNNGCAYIDALELDKNKSVNVYTYELMKGCDKNTGTDLEMPKN